MLFRILNKLYCLFLQEDMIKLSQIQTNIYLTLKNENLSHAMYPDHNGVCHIGPKCGIAHGDIADTALEPLTRSVRCGTVIAVAAENSVIEDMGTSAEDIEPVAPGRMGDATDVMECDVL